MAATPFKSVEFEKDEVITKDVLDQLHNNNQWIHDNTPRGRYYNFNGRGSDVETMIISGKAKFNKNTSTDTATVSVTFPANTFHPNCRPHIMTGINSDFQRKIFCIVNGPGDTNYPNSYGFQIKINVAANKDAQDHIQKDFFVHWHAFGYRVA